MSNASLSEERSASIDGLLQRCLDLAHQYPWLGHFAVSSTDIAIQRFFISPECSLNDNDRVERNRLIGHTIRLSVGWDQFRLCTSDGIPTQLSVRGRNLLRCGHLVAYVERQPIPSDSVIEEARVEFCQLSLELERLVRNENLNRDIQEPRVYPRRKSDGSTLWLRMLYETVHVSEFEVSVPLPEATSEKPDGVSVTMVVLQDNAFLVSAWLLRTLGSDSCQVGVTDHKFASISPSDRFAEESAVELLVIDDDAESQSEEILQSLPHPTGIAPTIEEALHWFEYGSEIVHVNGFGEAVHLERSEGVERLIAIVTKRRVAVMELARINKAQQPSNRNSVDVVDADRLSERESIEDYRPDAILGDEVPFSVREAVGDLIAQRNTAASRGDEQTEIELTAKINAILQDSKTERQIAAGAVRKSLVRTYKRLAKDDRGSALAAHFARFIRRARNEWDYVYDPDESHGKIDWIVK